MTVTLATWTLDQYHRMIEAGILVDQPVELLNGEIVLMPPEGEPHAYYSTDAKRYIETLLGDRAQVRESHSITLLASRSEPQPDLAIVQPLGREYRTHHPYPKNIFWLVEYANISLQKDLETKARVYAAAKICEYWVVNLRAMTLIVFREPIDVVYQVQMTLTAGTVAPIAFPDLSVSVERLLD